MTEISAEYYVKLRHWSELCGYMRPDELQAFQHRERPYQYDLFDPERLRPSVRALLAALIRYVNHELRMDQGSVHDPSTQFPGDEMLDYLATGALPGPQSALWPAICASGWQRMLECFFWYDWWPQELVADMDWLGHRLHRLGQCAEALLQRRDSFDPVTAIIRRTDRLLTPQRLRSWYGRLPSEFVREFAQPDMAYEWVRRIRNDFLTRLCLGSESLWQGTRYSIELIDATRYVFDSGERRAFTETRDAEGRWHRRGETWDLFRPLRSALWIQDYVRRWTQGPHPGLKAGEDWLVEALRREIKSLRLLKPLRRMLAKQMHPWRDLTLTALRTLPRCRVHALTGTQLSTTWQQFETLDARRRENPKLVHCLAWFLGTALDPGSDYATLKHELVARGLGEAGWKLLCRYGQRLYWPILNSAFQIPNAKVLVVHLNWLARCGAQRPDSRLVEAVCRMPWALRTEKFFETFPNGCLRAAAKQRDRLPASERAAFPGGEFRAVVWWIAVGRPQLDEQQKSAAGWAWWRQQARDWEVRQSSASVRWSFPIDEFHVGDYVARPLRSPWELLLETYRMHHCIYDYAGQCTDGRYRVWTIGNSRVENARATVGFGREKIGAHWRTTQCEVSGFANASVAPDLFAAAKALHKHLRWLEAGDPDAGQRAA